MYALTLHQPWATLHVCPCPLTNDQPAKRIESRGWPLTQYAVGRDGERLRTTGLRIAIHAGKGRADDSIRLGELFAEPFYKLLVACGYSAVYPWRRRVEYLDNFEQRSADVWFSKQERMYLKPLPLGALIGYVTYVDCVPGIDIQNAVARGTIPQHELELGLYSGPDRWGFIARDAIHFQPIACRGFQKLWRVPREIIMQTKHSTVPAPPNTPEEADAIDLANNPT